MTDFASILDNLDDRVLLTPPEGTTADPIPVNEPADVSNTVAWADDCMWASENIGGKMPKVRAGSTRRYYLWEYATKNTKDFIGQMLPKATMILDRAKSKPTGDESWLKEEKRSIEELQRTLRKIIREST